NQTYVISYYSPTGYFAWTDNFFANSGFSNGPLTALQDAIGLPNGVYSPGPDGIYPTDTYQSSNYWVDPVFSTSLPPNNTTDVLVASNAGTVTLGVSNTTGNSFAGTTYIDNESPQTID